MSSTHQVSLHESNDPSSLQKATTPELQITSDDEEADIRAKMAKCKRRKAARVEAAQLEVERLERERLEAEQCERERMEAEQREREQLEAERKEQEQLETECQEQEARAQQKPGEPKDKAWDKSTGAVGARSCKQCEKGQVQCTFSRAQQSKHKKRTCDWCTEMKVRCELPEGVEPEVEETGVKSGKKRAPEDVTSLRAGEKRKVVRTGSGVPGESEAGPSGVVAPTIISSDPLVVALGDLLGEFEFALRLSTPLSESSKELHSDVADLELKSLQSDRERAGVELDEGIMRRPEDMHMKGQWSDSGSREEKELWASDGEVFEGDSK
ncbi:hypothetical protein M404DRAFT_18193 [Pisolithus tinctorius Marx 270]|uniref:Zn(2)-C6 fungal-type domain-containing protein n=1 Tax=Pisolithus tinctorius Marx 270 TaxID=870435 RepID=A0A0C3PX19_PISTI|nr:hypothetical protein M404DRAFT_18193 [Pisolithus tinctorius Marx 270]